MEDTGEEKKQLPLFASLINRGTVHQPRWMISNRSGQVWNEEKEMFCCDKNDGTLYAKHHEACDAYNALMLKFYEKKPCRTYTAQVKILIHSDEEVDISDVRKWCHKSTRILLDTIGSGHGPMDDTYGLVQINWKTLEVEGG